MQVNVALKNSITKPDTYYVVINNLFYIKVRKELWYELSEYLEMDTSKSAESTDGFMRVVQTVQQKGHIFEIEDIVPTAKITE